MVPLPAVGVESSHAALVPTGIAGSCVSLNANR